MFKKYLPHIAVALLCMVTILPFLGLNEFNTKGEPREAVVALSMLKDGNWILPVNNGIDIPYKPPFFHWCIATLSMAQGYVSEYTSRLPSALALIIMAVGSFAFFAKRKNKRTAFIATCMLLTSFEVHRAGMNCRVDMLLTAFIVGALYLLYRWWERGKHGIPLLAIACMSGAVLTKGPIGFILPCLVMGIFFLLRGEKLLPTILRFTACALLSCVLPALWYVAAYEQGGDTFLNLVYEENFGRLLGKMSYESHNHPFTYNFLALIAGWAPWTLLCVIGLFVAPWNKFSVHKSWFRNIKNADPLQLFTWLSFIVILVFYCIPSSKRSTYLLPCYPFMAFLLAEFIIWIADKHHRVLKAFCLTLIAISVIITAAFIAIKTGMVPDTIFHGKHAPDNIAMLNAIRYYNLNIFREGLAIMPCIIGIVFIYQMCRNRNEHHKSLIYASITLVFLILMSLDGFFLPLMMNTKSDRPLAEMITKRYPHDNIYAYISAPMVHFFATDFYTGDRIRQFNIDHPRKGILMIGGKDKPSFLAANRDYTFSEEYHTAQPETEIKDIVYLIRFEKK